MNKLWVVVSIVGGVLAMMIFFYPTLYRYEDGDMMRINRITGAVEVAGAEGWHPPPPTEAPDKLDPITPEITKEFEAVTVASQDFESITLHNPGSWNLVLIEKAEVSFEKECGGNDYVTFITNDRSIPPNGDMTVRLPYSENYKKGLIAGCGGAPHKRTVSLILNSGYGPEGKRWDAQSRLVSRKIEGEVPVPAS